MKTITLNGGNYGGTVVEIEDDTDTMLVPDGSGSLWTYSLYRHAETDTADYIGMTQSTDVAARSPNTATVKI